VAGKMMTTCVDQTLLLEKLKQHWGYDSFRPLQSEGIACIMQRRDSVMVLPTGGGKSLCFQLPALCVDGLAVVVSPLISLMKDQVDALVSNGIAAASINSSMSIDQRQQVAGEIRAGRLRLLYVSPERLVTDATIKFLQENNVAFFAIDEAHCISSWGHDFRPEYRQLGSLKTLFPDASIHAYTATATERVRGDIASELNLVDAEFLVGSFDRPNLVYRVDYRSDMLSQLRQVIERYPKQAGIVYCISRKEVDNVSHTLSELGHRARPYHAGLSDQERTANQDDFINERIDIIVATVAFGMGIDKSNVRYVVHAGMPKSLEAYQQESGRAGRDGLESECTLLFTGSDLMIWKKMQDNNTPAAKALLEAMYQYCTRSQCRHRMLVEYFGQEFESDHCGACDYCLGELQPVDEPLIMAQKIISCVYRVDQRFGADYVSLVLAGSADKRILDNRHDRLSTYGLLSAENRNHVRDWIEQLVAQGFLQKSSEYQVLTISETGHQVLRSETIPELYRPKQVVKKSAAKTVADWEGVDRELFEQLRELRRQLAAEKQIPAYVVFHDATLREMARQRPSTSTALGRITGVGEKKLADYGAQFVKFITEYCDQNGVSLDQPASRAAVVISAPKSQKSKLKIKAKEDAFAMFANGESLDAVCQQIDRARSTLSQYLAEYIAEQKIADPSPWIEATKASRIRAAIDQVGSLERLAPIKEILGDDCHYEEIRVVVECIKVETGYHAANE
jgi:ATP-dependent DNA helicase RecQ